MVPVLRLVGLFAASTGLLLSMATAARGAEGSPAFRVVEKSTDHLRWSRPKKAEGLEVRTQRRLRVKVRVALEDEGPEAFTAGTPFGLRLGTRTFSGTLGDDPRWKPGRAGARFLLEADDGSAATAVLTWKRGVLRASIRSTEATPLAESVEDGPVGEVEAALAPALRLGANRFRFAGSARGRVERRSLEVLGATVDLARVRVAGNPVLVPPEDDGVPPAVVLTAPFPEAIVSQDGVELTGTIRDDFTLDRLTWSVDGGPEQEAPFETDGATGYLDDLLGSFSFTVPVAEGAHDLEVRVYDAAGNAATAELTVIAVEPRLVPLSAGMQCTAVVDDAGDVWLFGWHYLFRDPENPTASWSRWIPQRIEGFEGSVAVAVDNYHLLALRSDGTVRAAGYNITGILGLGHTDDVEGIVTVPGLTGVVALVSGFDFAAALKADGTLWTWGRNAYGQLWTGDDDPRTSPTQVAGMPPIRSVHAGPYDLSAVDENGFLWRRGSYPSLEPEILAGPEDVVSVASYGALLVVERSGRVWSQGLNNRGQCGRGVHGYSLPLGLVPGITNAVGAAGGGLHSLLVLEDGTVLSVGSDSNGQRGDGPPTGSDWTLSFAPVPGLDQVQQVVAAHDRSFSVRRDGSIHAWGMGGYGELGTASAGVKDAPTPVMPGY